MQKWIVGGVLRKPVHRGRESFLHSSPFHELNAEVSPAEYGVSRFCS